VTSNDAALAVPDWPLAWGRLVPPLEGGIRYEFAHRVLAATVALLTGVLAFRLQVRERRRWLRRLGWGLLAAVLAQALLGGALVKLVDPKALAISHACLAQLCFGLAVAIALGLGEPLRQSESAWGGAGDSVAPRLAVVAVFVQTILGAALRHNALGLASHVVGAIAATALAMWAALQILIHHMEEPRLRRPALQLLYLTGAQLFLGFAAYTAREATAGDPQPMPIMIWATVAHVVVGSLVFGAAIALAMRVRSGRNQSQSPRTSG